MSDAAIFPYGNNEDSILYRSYNWSELQMLLTNPVDYLGVQSMVNSPMLWTLRRAATVVLESFDHTPETAIRFGLLFGLIKQDELKGKPSASGKDGTKLRINELADQVIAAAYSSPTLADGSFMAEFALNTGVLCIRYKVPTAYQYPNPNEKPPQDKFKGTLTQGTYIGVDGESIGNLHFDIVPSAGHNEMNRAALMIDMIENFYRVTKDLGATLYGQAEMEPVQPGPPLPVPAPSGQTTSLNWVFTDWRPLIVAEDMSPVEAPDPCGICIDGQTFTITNDQGVVEYHIAGVVYKCYMPPAPVGIQSK